MKKKLRILTLALVSALTFSCSSDDSSTPDGGTQEGKTKDIKVIDNSIYTIFDEGGETRTVTTKYSYNDDGTVKKSEELTTFSKDPKLTEKETVTYTYQNGLPLLITTESYDMDSPYEKTDFQYTYKNNRIEEGKQTNYETPSKVTLFKFSYNDKGQLTSTKTDDTNDNTTYTYDEKGNLIKVVHNSTTELIEYDDKKSPYTNMNISDQKYSMEYFETYDQFLIRSPHNVTKTIFNATGEDNKITHLLTNEYDKDGYLTATTEMNNNQKESEVKYIYKTIKVSVK
ncbi:MAG: RHS repeat protein [Myroides sp.]|jgi:YD repeat-containing protein|nr:RHS repeat protein [Myroides sp.]